MSNLNILTAFLPLIALLPAFQGSGGSTTQQTGYTDFYFTTYKKGKKSGNIPVKPTSYLTDDYKISEQKKLSLPSQDLNKNTIKKALLAIIGNNGSLTLTKNYSIWVEQAGNDSNNPKFVQLRLMKSIDTVKNIAILVTESVSVGVINNINEWSNKTHNSTNVQSTNHPRGETENKKEWSWKKIVGYSATGIFVALCIGGVIYYFFIPTKKASSSRYEENEDEEDEEL